MQSEPTQYHACKQLVGLRGLTSIGWSEIGESANDLDVDVLVGLQGLTSIALIVMNMYVCICMSAHQHWITIT